MPPISSDHKAVVARIRFRWCRSSKAKRDKSNLSSLVKLWSPSVCSEFDSWLSSILPTPASTITQLFDAISVASSHMKLSDTTEDVLVTAPWKDSTHVALAVSAEASKNVSQSLADAILASVESAESQSTTRLVTQFANQLREHPWQAWRCLSRAKVRGVERGIDSSAAERFYNHFSTLLSTPSVTVGDLCLQNNPPQTHPFDTGEVTTDEIKSALSTLANHKAAGPSQITSELLSSAISSLARIFSTWLHDGKVDETVVRATFVPLYKKKGDASDPGNFRGISIQEHVVKLFMKVLLGRVSSVLDPHVLAYQAGFRCGRSTAQQCAALNCLQHIACSHRNYPLCCGFIDFSKAFDSINRERCAAILSWWHVPETWISCIMSYWAGVRLEIRLPREFDPIRTKAGVLQGDALSPFIFVLVMDYVLRALRSANGVPVTNKRSDGTFLRLPALAYADDVVLLAESPRLLQQNLHLLQERAATVGLRLNLGANKTEWFSTKSVAENWFHQCVEEAALALFRHH